MPITSQKVPDTSPLTAELLTASINEVVGELFRRSFAEVQNPLGTNSYTGAVALDRPLEDGNGFAMRVPNTNTGASFYNNVPLRTATGAALQGGELQADAMVLFRYSAADGQHRIVTPLGGGAAPIRRVYTSNATWTKSAGLRYVEVQCQAGAGSGGGRFLETIVSNPGGNSSFGTLLTAVGGGQSGVRNPGAGGVNADFSVPGQIGGTGVAFTTTPTLLFSGKGGDSAMGFGGLAVMVSGGQNSNGSDGAGYGSGGSGTTVAPSFVNNGGGGGEMTRRVIAAGLLPASVSVTVGLGGAGAGSPVSGAGAPGIVIVTEYY